MLAHVKQVRAGITYALRVLVFALALVVFAVLNPLACVWHCALHNHLAEHAAHNQHHGQMRSAHQHHALSNVIADNGDTAHIRGGSPIAAVHYGVIYTTISLVLALLVVMLNRTVVLLRRPCATIVPFPPPPKHTPRYV